MKSTTIEYSLERQRKDAKRHVIVRTARDQQIRRHLAVLFVIFTILGVTIGFMAAPVVKSTAASKYQEQTVTVYQSVQIEPGQTLTDLEQIYNTDGSMTSKEYIDTVMKINQISDTNKIHSGAYLTVPVFKRV